MSGAETLNVRERIMEMATRLFVSQGYNGIAMREIAEACNLSKAGLYYHFRDKEDLFLAILEENLTSLEQLLAETGVFSGTAREKISYFVRVIFTRLSTDQRAIIRLASQEMNKVSPEARSGFDRRYQEHFINRLAGFLQVGIVAGELREMDAQMGVWGLLGLMYPFFTPEHPLLPSQTEAVIDFILTVFFDGVQIND